MIHGVGSADSNELYVDVPGEFIDKPAVIAMADGYLPYYNFAVNESNNALLVNGEVKKLGIHPLNLTFFMLEDWFKKYNLVLYNNREYARLILENDGVTDITIDFDVDNSCYWDLGFEKKSYTITPGQKLLAPAIYHFGDRSEILIGHANIGPMNRAQDGSRIVSYRSLFYIFKHLGMMSMSPERVTSGPVMVDKCPPQLRVRVEKQNGEKVKFDAEWFLVFQLQGFTND